ncbi:MAG: RNA polymerase sigma factor [Myxococcota bacterium]
MGEGNASAALVEAVRRGDADARARLVDEWLPVVLRWCTCLGGPLVDPEDAAHDVLVLALTRLDGLREPAHLPAWLFGVTRRVLARHRRSRWLRSWMPGATAELVDASDTPQRRRERDELTERVQAVIDRMPWDLREVLVLSVVEERPQDEVMALLGVPLGTVKSRLRRARVRFEQLARVAGLASDPTLLGGGEP